MVPNNTTNYFQCFFSIFSKFSKGLLACKAKASSNLFSNFCRFSLFFYFNFKLLLYCWGPLSAKYARLRCHSTVFHRFPSFPPFTAHFCAKRAILSWSTAKAKKSCRLVQKCAVTAWKRGICEQTVEWHRNRAYLAESGPQQYNRYAM